jgi:hypothetical protein
MRWQDPKFSVARRFARQAVDEAEAVLAVPPLFVARAEPFRWPAERKCQEAAP